MSIWKKIVPFFVIASVPVLYFIIPFICGFYNLPEADLFWVLLCLFFGPPIAGFVASFLAATIWKRTLIGFGTMIILFMSYFILPISPDGLSLGMSANIRTRTDPKRIQQWACKILDQYENGALETVTNANGWAGEVTLAIKSIPPQITNSWPNPPCIGLVTVADANTGTIIDSTPATNEVLPYLATGSNSVHLTHWVALVWNNREGFLIGRPNADLTWQSGSKIMPGIYSFWPGN